MERAVEGVLLDIPERGDAASLTEKLDCVTALWPRGGSWGKHGVGDSKAPGSVAAAQQHRLLILVCTAAAESYLHLSFRGRGSHTNAPNKPAPVRKEIMMAQR